MKRILIIASSCFALSCATKQALVNEGLEVVTSKSDLQEFNAYERNILTTDYYGDFLFGEVALQPANGLKVDTTKFKSAGVEFSIWPVASGKYGFNVNAKPTARSKLQSDKVTKWLVKKNTNINSVRTITKEVKVNRKSFWLTIKDFLLASLIGVSALMILYYLIRKKWKI